MSVDGRQFKKFLLFVSDQNPVWERISKLEIQLGRRLAFPNNVPSRSVDPGSRSRNRLEQTRTVPPSPREVLLGISDTTLKSWMRGDIGTRNNFVPRLGRLHDALLETLNRLGQTRDLFHEPSAIADEAACKAELKEVASQIQQFSVDWERMDGGMKVYACAQHILKVEVSAAQIALDKYYNRQTPLLQHAYFESHDRASQAFDQIGGVYAAWMLRGDVVMRCALHARYVLDFGQRHFIRAKLNLPVIKPSPKDWLQAQRAEQKWPYWEYDGFVQSGENKCFWNFDKRSTERHDFFTIATTRRLSRRDWSGPKGEPFSGFHGLYLTANQDPSQSLVAGPILLERIHEDSTSDLEQIDPARLMWAQPRIFNSTDPEARRVMSILDDLGDTNFGSSWPRVPSEVRGA